MFFSCCRPRSSNSKSTLSAMWWWTVPETKMLPGSASASSRAAILTPSPKISPPSAITSPRLMPIRMAMRCSLGKFWLCRTIASRRAAAERAASTTLPNSLSTRSPVCLKMLPSNCEISGTIIWVRQNRSPVKLPLSSREKSGLRPATRTAASRRLARPFASSDTTQSFGRPRNRNIPAPLGNYK